MKPLLLALFLLASLQAYSITITWDGGAGNGLWSSATNWSPDQVPTAADDVVIANAIVTLDVANITIQSLTLPPTFNVQENRILGVSNLTITGNFELGNGFIENDINLNIGQNLNWTSGHIYGTSMVTIAGSLNFVPSYIFAYNPDRYTTRGFVAATGSAPLPNFNGGNLRLDAPGHVTINGTFSVNRDFHISLYFGTGGTFTSNSTLDIAPGKTITFSNLLFTNNGTCNLGAGSVLIAERHFTNSGTINMGLNSTVLVTQVLNNSGALNGSGTLTTNNTFNQSGTISPGLSPGILNMNKLTAGTTSTYIEMQGSTTPGTDYDQIAVTGAGVISGTLNISFLNNYEPTVGSEFIIMTCSGGCSGSFSNIVHLGNNPNAWQIDMTNPNQVKLVLAQSLPVELVSLTAQALTENTALLQWQTASELNNRGFEVQRSDDGVRWQEIGFVNGYGTTTETQHYTLLDKEPLGGTNYYRLRQIDFDGTANLSNIVVVKGSDKHSELQLNPNPAYDMVEIKGVDMSTEPLLKIIDATGRPLLEQRLNSSTLDVSALPPGIYHLVLYDSKGAFQTGRLVRQ